MGKIDIKTYKIDIRFNHEVLNLIDEASAKCHITRGYFIRATIRQILKDRELPVVPIKELEMYDKLKVSKLDTVVTVKNSPASVSEIDIDELRNRVLICALVELNRALKPIPAYDGEYLMINNED